MGERHIRPSIIRRPAIRAISCSPLIEHSYSLIVVFLVHLAIFQPVLECC
jgi:hypothetical protein